MSHDINTIELLQRWLQIYELENVTKSYLIGSITEKTGDEVLNEKWNFSSTTFISNFESLNTALIQKINSKIQTSSAIDTQTINNHLQDGDWIWYLFAKYFSRNLLKSAEIVDYKIDYAKITPPKRSMLDVLYQFSSHFLFHLWWK